MPNSSLTHAQKLGLIDDIRRLIIMGGVTRIPEIFWTRITAKYNIESESRAINSWKYMKARFMILYREQITSPTKPITWIYYDHLMFLSNVPRSPSIARDAKLVREVRKYPMLYNMHIKRNFLEIFIIWKKIASVCGFPDGSVAKNRYTNLRSCFLRAKRKNAIDRSPNFQLYLEMEYIFYCDSDGLQVPSLQNLARQEFRRSFCRTIALQERLEALPIPQYYKSFIKDYTD